MHFRKMHFRNAPRTPAGRARALAHAAPLALSQPAALRDWTPRPTPAANRARIKAMCAIGSAFGRAETTAKRAVPGRLMNIWRKSNIKTQI